MHARRRARRRTRREIELGRGQRLAEAELGGRRTARRLGHRRQRAAEIAEATDGGVAAFARTEQLIEVASRRARFSRELVDLDVDRTRDRSEATAVLLLGQ